MLLLNVCAAWALVAQAPTLEIAPDRATGVYQPGDTVRWKVKAVGQPGDGELAFDVLQGGAKSVKKGSMPFGAGKAEIAAALDVPGVLLLRATWRKRTAHAGVAFAPERIKPSLPPPDDFDAFWQAKVAELHAVPANPQVQRIDVGDPKVEYGQFTLDNFRGRKVRGQYAKPAGGTALPALLQVQSAGVYALDKNQVLGHARSGWLAVNISAHDLPIDAPPDFYAKQAKGPLDDYPGIGNDGRETSYFLPMFLGIRRTVDWIEQRPDWDKKALVAHGGSQGGYQAFVAAGLCPAVTAFAANVPAGCDHTGAQAGRAPGWPNWASRTWKGRDPAKMLAAARYFDAMNFAARARQPALVGIGLADVVCPAEGVLATCNNLGGRKDLVLMPAAGHGGDHRAYHAKFGAFLNAQRRR